MSIEELTAEIIEAVKTRETFPCDSNEYEQADERVNELIFSIKTEDIPAFNKLYNQPENWK